MANGVQLPLRWGEIDAWMRVTRIPLTTWEVAVLTTIDDVWLAVMGKQSVTEDDLVEPETAADAGME